MFPTVARVAWAMATLGAAPGAAIPVGRTTTVIATDLVGAPAELAFPSPAYARAAEADAAEDWGAAQALYRQAAADWRLVARTRPSRALDLAITKAEMEALASETLAIRAREDEQSPERTPPGGRTPPGSGSDAVVHELRRDRAVERARLLRAKVMAVRAVEGVLPSALYADARREIEAARAIDARRPGARSPGPGAELDLAACALDAVAARPDAAQAFKARVTEAERDDPANLVSLAACAAALGQTADAIAALERFTLGAVVPRPDRVLREVYLSNDWDRLRGDPRFETLFP